mmetsp:Transcript_37766/g.125117  ORF Transcript_37766/g.125117 Transcript_37766/m.125117 type:complete len:358 (+) Transcript_37766:249-1322(+)
MTDPTPAAAARLCRLLHLAADLMATSSTSAAAARRPEEPALEIALATAANAAPAVGAALLTRGYTVVTAGAEEDEDGASNGDDTLNPIQIILSSVNDYAMQNLQTVSTTPPARARSCASWSEPSPPPKFTPMRRCAHTMSSYECGHEYGRRKHRKAQRGGGRSLHGQPSSFHLAAAASRHAFGRSPSPPPRRCHGGSSRRRRPATRAHPCHRARRPEARVRRAARAVAVERAPRCRSSPRASKRGAASAAGAAGGARYNASQAEPRRRRGRSRSLPRARRSPPIRTRSWRPSRPARTPQCAHQPHSEQCGGHWARATSALPGAVAVRAGRSEAPRPPGDRVGRAGQRRATAGVVVDL